MGVGEQLDLLSDPSCIAILVLSGFLYFLAGVAVKPEETCGSNKQGYPAGLLCQIVLVPAVCYGIAYGWDLGPTQLQGTVIASIVPGSIMAPFYTLISFGDFEASVLLTILSTILSFFIMPVSFWCFEHSYAGNATGLPNYEVTTVVDFFPFIFFAIFTLLVVLCPALGCVTASKVQVKELWVKLAMGLLFIAISIALLVGYVVPGFATFDRIGWETLALCVVIKITSLVLGHGVALASCLAQKTAFAIGLTSAMQNTLAGFMFIALLDLDVETKADLNAFMSCYTVVQLVVALLYVAIGVGLHTQSSELSEGSKGHSEVAFHGVPTEEPTKDLHVDVNDGYHQGGDSDMASIEMQAILPDVIPPVLSPPAQPDNDPAFQTASEAKAVPALSTRDSAEIMLIETLRKDFGGSSGVVPRGVSYSQHNRDANNAPPASSAAASSSANIEELVHDLPAEFGFRNHIVYDDNANFEPDDGHIRYFNPDADTEA